MTLTHATGSAKCLILMSGAKFLVMTMELIMKIERSFSPVTITLETEGEVQSMCTLMSGCMASLRLKHPEAKLAMMICNELEK